MPDKAGFEWGTGRRKCSVARVRVRPGSGKVEVNGHEFKDYFLTERLCKLAVSPLQQVGAQAKYDVFANIRGGGIAGQAGAMMMGLGRALLKIDPEQRHQLKEHGCLSRDSRMVERKKPGKPGARKSFQFSKR